MRKCKDAVLLVYSTFNTQISIFIDSIDSLFTFTELLNVLCIQT